MLHPLKLILAASFCRRGRGAIAICERVSPIGSRMARSRNDGAVPFAGIKCTRDTAPVCPLFCHRRCTASGVPISITESKSGKQRECPQRIERAGSKRRGVPCERKFARSFEITAAVTQYPSRLLDPEPSSSGLREFRPFSTCFRTIASTRVCPCRTTSNEGLGVGEHMRNADTIDSVSGHDIGKPEQRRSVVARVTRHDIDRLRRSPVSSMFQMKDPFVRTVSWSQYWNTTPRFRKAGETTRSTTELSCNSRKLLKRPAATRLWPPITFWARRLINAQSGINESFTFAADFLEK